MVRRTSVLLAAVALVSTLSMAPAQAYHGNGLHWAGSGVRTVYVTDKTRSATWSQIIDRAINIWNSGRTNVHLVRRTGSGSCGMTGGDMEVCLGGTSAGVAHWSYNASTRNFNGTSINVNGNATRYGDALMCHEIGHSLGLAHRHPNETSSCMTPAVAPGQTHPDQHDYETVAAQNR